MPNPNCTTCPNSMERRLTTTADGSHSLYVPELDEHYHSRHGAVQESQHVFIRMGWEALPADLDAPRILEIGFGAGLNALLTALVAGMAQKSVSYVGVEAYPLNAEEAASLNYAEYLGHPEAGAILQRLHASEWGQDVEVNAHFRLRKLQARIEDFVLDAPVHLIYFDAFAPQKQPELWSPEIFAHMHACLLPGGLLTTYCAKGEVRRAMLSAGFRVERMPGPPGKREMLRAWRD